MKLLLKLIIIVAVVCTIDYVGIALLIDQWNTKNWSTEENLSYVLINAFISLIIVNVVDNKPINKDR